MRKILFAIAALGLCVSAAAFQQPAQQTAPAGLILGRVVDAVTNDPLPGVLVNLSFLKPPAPDAPRLLEPRIITDAQGRFLFRGVPAAAYYVQATVGGLNAYSPNGFVVTGVGFPIGAYLSGGYGQRRVNGPLQALELAEGQRVGDVVIRLWKSGAITGRLTDETGEPLVSQVVGAARLTSGGRPTQGPTVRTDDRGIYRLAALTPGSYVVFVPQTQVSMPVSTGEETAAAADPNTYQRFSNANAPSPTIGGVRVGSSLIATTPESGRFEGGALISNALAPVRDGDAMFVYPTTFYPSSTKLAQSSRISLKPGEERSGVDVVLRPARATSITGVMMDDAGLVPNVGLHLMPADQGNEASILEVAATATDGRGAFSFPVVPEGQYTIVAWRTGGPAGAQQPASRIGESAGAWAKQVVTVGARPVDNITVTMRPPVTVSGNVVFDGASDRPPADRLRNFPVTTYPASPLFRSPGPSAGSTIDMAANGRIQIRNVSPPGRFAFGPPSLPAPWTLQSISVGGRDVTDATFDLGESDIVDVVITYTDRPATLSGTVAMGSDNNDPGVFLFPSTPSRWRDARLSTRSFLAARPTKAGAFSFATVPPGDYFIVAVPDESAGTWPDEEFLARLAAIATPVRIAPNQAATVALRVSAIK